MYAAAHPSGEETPTGTLYDWFKKTRATYSTDQVQDQNQWRLGHTRFPALGAGFTTLT